MSMASSYCISHFALLFLVCLLLWPLPMVVCLNITSLLSPFPDLSRFSALLSSTLSPDLSPLSSLTVLAVPNALLPPSLPPSPSLPSLLRLHLLPLPLPLPLLLSLPPSGRLFPSLLPSSPLNISHNPLLRHVIILPPSSPSNATLLLHSLPLPSPNPNISVFTISSLIVPSGLDLMASAARPTPSLNITSILIDAHNFNVAASMLAASGVISEFEADEGGAGITMFVPVDDAFAALPPSAALQSLPADKKAVVLKFHVLHSYYPLGSLQSIVNPVQPTLATEAMGASSFTLNISRLNGSVAINTGIVQASVTQTVFDQNPVAIFGVSKVLLPKEVFGKNPIAITEGAPPPDSLLMSPENSPGLDGQPSHLSSPPGFREEIGSMAACSSCAYNMALFIVFLWCIGLCVVV